MIFHQKLPVNIKETIVFKILILRTIVIFLTDARISIFICNRFYLHSYEIYVRMITSVDARGCRGIG